jgi:hypothetical protein
MSLRRTRRFRLLDSIATLAVIGLLAGVLGGLGVGVMSQKSSPASAATH